MRKVIEFVECAIGFMAGSFVGLMITLNIVEKRWGWGIVLLLSLGAIVVEVIIIILIDYLESVIRTGKYRKFIGIMVGIAMVATICTVTIYFATYSPDGKTSTTEYGEVHPWNNPNSDAANVPGVTGHNF
jgi:hypothetical protein